MILRANAVGVDDSDDCLTLGFAEESDGSGPALVLQRAREFAEKDVKAGTATYCLTTDTQTTTYGGIESWQLAEGWLKLKLSTKAAEDLGCDSDLIIQFAPIHTDAVRTAFDRIVKAP